MWKWMGLLTFSFKLHWGSYIISIAKTASKKSGALICSMKFFSPEPEGALYLHCSQSEIWYAWTFVAMSGLVLLVATWNCWISYKTRTVWQNCRTGSPSLAASLYPRVIVTMKLALSLCPLFFLSNFYFFHQMIGLQKLWKIFSISYKKLFLFSRYSNFCNFFPSFPHFPDSKGQMEMEQFMMS